ncbi:hypothetical protein GCM10022415_28920 [Knoellia locipacati]|uniref:HTH cro/C1-type domain-containing protein n=1 Tax=Knoellia locipacati TaxID=882824 RepID=A0A512T4X9_9MICO|nr:helix-turn-helix transcriptional regulator [Knoellia locipacati]GEQ15131.1 hypothetical protein KLO01_31780 [Knoellia locipacati]
MQSFKSQVWQSFGRSLREAREQRGMTQDEVARALLRFGSGGTQSSIAKMERGDRMVGIDHLAALAWILRVDADRLLPLVVDREDEDAHVAALMAEREHLAAQRRELQNRWEKVERQLLAVDSPPNRQVVLVPEGRDDGKHSEEA